MKPEFPQAHAKRNWLLDSLGPAFNRLGLMLELAAQPVLPSLHISPVGEALRIFWESTWDAIIFDPCDVCGWWTQLSNRGWPLWHGSVCLRDCQVLVFPAQMSFWESPLPSNDQDGPTNHGLFLHRSVGVASFRAVHERRGDRCLCDAAASSLLRLREASPVGGPNPLRTTLKQWATIVGWYLQGEWVSWVVEDFVHPQCD